MDAGDATSTRPSIRSGAVSGSPSFSSVEADFQFPKYPGDELASCRLLVIQIDHCMRRSQAVLDTAAGSTDREPVRKVGHCYSCPAETGDAATGPSLGHLLGKNTSEHMYPIHSRAGFRSDKAPDFPLRMPAGEPRLSEDFVG